jgi:hypothetical protein
LPSAGSGCPNPGDGFFEQGQATLDLFVFGFQTLDGFHDDSTSQLVPDLPQEILPPPDLTLVFDALRGEPVYNPQDTTALLRFGQPLNNFFSSIPFFQAKA